VKQRSIVLTSRQWEFLRKRAATYGITVADALRRLLDTLLDGLDEKK
jgi:hypothetical protein